MRKEGKEMSVGGVRVLVDKREQEVELGITIHY